VQNGNRIHSGMSAPYTNLITACAVVRNEEKLIERCIKSAKQVTDSIIVVHNGPCDDRTVDICRSLGCEVYIKPLTGLCGEEHRVFAYSQVKNPWILLLDADEYLSDGLIDEMGQLLSAKDIACYSLSWPYWDGYQYRTKNWPRKRALFRRNQIQYLAFPHDDIRANGTVEKSDKMLEHRPLYDNYSVRSLRDKHKKWIQIHAEYHLKDFSTLMAYPDGCSSLQPHYGMIKNAPLLIAPFIFIYHFAGLMVLGGFKQGWYGFRNSLAQAVYYFSLCREVHRQKCVNCRR